MELRPESTNPVCEPIQIDLKTDALEIATVAVGTLIGNSQTSPVDSGPSPRALVRLSC